MENTLAQYKALLFDADGTLSGTQVDVSPHTQTALQQLHQAGYTIGLCSGRHFAQLKDRFIPFFPDDALHVVSGGAQVITSQGNVIWSRNIPSEVALRLYAKATAEHIGFITANGNASYANDVAAQMVATAPGTIASTFVPIENIATWSVPIISIWKYTPSFLEYLQMHQNDVSYKLMNSPRHGPYIDVTARDITKALGVTEWCELSHISASEVIGFGDSDNDEEFLRMIGFSVAMGNGTDTIKQLANRVIGTNAEDGLATYLQQILGGTEL